MGKKVLIISKSFAPKNSISAIRPTKLAKYLIQANYSVSILTEDENYSIKDCLLNEGVEFVSRRILIKEKKWVHILNRIIKGLVQRERSIETRAINDTDYQEENKTVRFKKIIKEHINFLINVIKEYSYSNSAKKQLRGIKEDYDIILSTFGPYSAHWIARGYLKKKKAYWVADFRDQTWLPETPKLFIPFCKKYTEKVVNQADLLTFISPGVIDDMGMRENSKVKLLYNGFDRDDIRNITNRKTNDGIFRFVYAGQIYKRDFSLFFMAISELIREGSLNTKDIILEYAGHHFNSLYNQAGKFGVQNILNDNGYIERQQSLELQLSSQILLLASSNSVGYTGIVTGKYLEYMMMGKPVICIMAGNLPNSQLKQMIEQAQMGICCEEAIGEPDYHKLKQYILHRYIEYKKNNEIHFKPNLEYIETFNYKKIVTELENTINR